MKLSINLLRHAKSDACVICLIIHTPVIAYALLSYWCCTPKQIDLTSALFLYSCLIVSLYYCQQANVNRQLHNIQTSLLYGASTKSFNKTILALCKPLFIVNVRVKGHLKLYWSTNTKRLTSKSGRGTCITRLYKRWVSSFSADKWGLIVQ